MLANGGSAVSATTISSFNLEIKSEALDSTQRIAFSDFALQHMK
jgi:hypothetical protein